MAKLYRSAAKRLREEVWVDGWAYQESDIDVMGDHGSHPVSYQHSTVVSITVTKITFILGSDYTISAMGCVIGDAQNRKRRQAMSAQQALQTRGQNVLFVSLLLVVCPEGFPV